MGTYQKGKNWYIDYYYKGRRKRKKIGPSKKLAQQVLKDVQVKMIKKEYLGVYEEKKITFSKYSKLYLEYSKANKAFSTYNRHDRISINRLKPYFKDKYIYEITPQMIEKYKTKRLETVSPASVNRELATLKNMFTMAIKWGYVKKNPVKEVRLLKEPPGRLRYLKPEEVKALYASCSDHIHPIIVTALNTGMRKGELLKMKWTDVDFKNRKITILNAKNNESRVVPINKTLHKELFPLSKSSKGECVFSDKNGHPYGDIKKSFLTALKKAKIEDFRFHDLRHTFGSYLVMQEVNLKTVQQIMGHKDIRMTMRYAHLSPEYVQKAVETLDKVWSLFGHQGDITNNEK